MIEEKTSKFITITYMIYIILYESLIIGGFGYVVFWRGENPWWMLLAVLLSSAAYSPKKWKKLFN
jgi:hypothetical protein